MAEGEGGSSTGSGSSAENNLRIAILGNADSYLEALKKVEEASKKTGEKVTETFGHVKGFLLKSIGVGGLALGIEKSVEDATKLVSLQRVQAQVISNQYKGTSSLQQMNLVGAKSQTFWYSKLLDQQATYESVQTGINKDQVVQSQTLLLTNKDLASMFTKGAKNSQGINENFSNALHAAENMSAVTGQGLVTSAKMLGRVLADPAKRISMMNRGGVQLTQNEQNYVKQVEAANGKMAARAAVIDLINSHIQGAAEAAKSPLERLQNDVMLLMTSFGKIFLPMLDAFAKVIGDIVTLFGPILNSLLGPMNILGEEIGQALGSIMAAFEPLIMLFVRTLLPALLTILQPVIGLVGAVAKPLGNLFTTLFGTENKIGPVAQAITTMATQMAGPMTSAVNAIAPLFTQLFSNKQTIDSITKIFTILAPVLPALGLAFAQLALAITPILIKATPLLIVLIQWTARLVAKIAEIIPKVTGFISSLAKIAPIKDMMIILATVWFTKKLFLTPMMGVLGLLGKIGSGVKSVYGTAANGARTLGGIHSKGLGGSLEAEAKRAEQKRLRDAAWHESRGKYEKAEKLLKVDERNPEAHLYKAERRYAAYARRAEQVEARGGGVRGLFKALFNLGSGTLSSETMPKDQLDATNLNTQALNTLTNEIGNANGLLGGNGGGGNDLEHKLENKLENKLKSKLEGKVKSELEGKVKSELEHKLEGKLEGKLAGKLEGNVGKRLLGKVLDRFGGRAGQMLSRLGGLGGDAAAAGEEGAAVAGGEAAAEGGAAVAGGEAAAEGGILAAGAASGAATLGIGLAVAGVTVAYMKWHKQINKAVIGAAKHLYHAAQRVGHWASQEGHHLWNATKDVAKFGGKVLSHVGHAVMGAVTGGLHAAGTIMHGVGSAIGGFFGGLFGGGGGSKTSGGGSGGMTHWLIRIAHHTYDTANLLRGKGGDREIHRMMNHPAMKKMAVAHSNEVMKRAISSLLGGGIIGSIAGAVGVHAATANKSINRNRGGGNMIIEKGAFVITVNGAVHPDEHAKVIQKVVNDNMKELQRALRALGRGI